MREKKILEIKKLKSGSFVLIEDDVYRVEKLQTSKPGKHGGAKARITAKGVFNDQKKGIVKPASEKMKVPIIQKKAAQVVAVMGDDVQLMDLDTYETTNIPLKDKFKGKLESGDEVVIWKYGNNVLIKNKK